MNALRSAREWIARNPRHQTIVFFLFALLTLAIGLGLRDPWPSDEPRFALVARQMLLSGDWLFPHRGVELYADKPPLFMWLQAVSYWLTGGWRGWFLLPSLLSALGTLALTYDLGKRLWNHRAGLYAGTAVLFAFQFMYQMKRAQIDPLITFWITLANWGLLLHFLRGPNWRAYMLGCFAAGLGVITKGVGIIALLMFLPYVWACRRGWSNVHRESARDPRWWLGLLAFVIPVLGWAVPMLLAAHARGTPEYQAYVQDILFHQTAQRYAGSWSHPQAPWYYVAIVLFNWFPVSLLYVGGVPRWWRDLKAGEARIMLPLVWTLLVLLFFSIPTGKRDVYILPALPMTALALSPYIAELIKARWLRIAAFAIALVGGIVILIAGVLALQGKVPAARDFLLRRDLVEQAVSMWHMVIAIGAVLILSAICFRPRCGALALLGGLAGLWIIWALWAYPLLNDSSSAAGIMRDARTIAGPQAEMGLVAPREQNLLMAVGPTREFGFTAPWTTQFQRATAWQREAPASRWIFSLDQAMGNCVDTSKARLVGMANRRQWWLFRSDAVIPGCAPSPGPPDAVDKTDAQDQ